MKVLLANRNRFIFAELRPLELTLGVPGYLYFSLFLGINLVVDGRLPWFIVILVLVHCHRPVNLRFFIQNLNVVTPLLVFH
jgi:hypothetical protein